MSWKKALPEPIVLKDGRKLATMREAGEFILRLSDRIQASPTVTYATELLLMAVQTGKREDVSDAAHQVSRALKAHGFIGR